MSDLTLLFYTANKIGARFAVSVRRELEPSAQKYGLICISQKQMDFYDEERAFIYRSPSYIWVGEIGASIYNVYKQILIGAKAATTPFVACVEDDSLYTPGHFTYRPAPDVFAYNRNRWVISRRLDAKGRSREAFFYFRERTQMAQCICARELLVDTLEERFAKFPEPIADAEAYKTGWGEPGRYEKNLGLSPRKREYFESAEPNVTFNHTDSIRGRRAVKDTDTIVSDLPPWGNATELWNRIHG